MSRNSVVASFDIGTKNLAYCLLDVVTPSNGTKTVSIHAWDVLTIPGGTYDLLPRRLSNILDSLLTSWSSNNNDPHTKPDTILIEKQPGRNKTMVRVEAYLHMYFLAKGYNNIFLISPKDKLKAVQCNFAGSSREAYSLRKKSAVEATKQILGTATCFTDAKNQESALLAFSRHNKKDDLADAFLQGLSHAKIDVASTCGNDTRQGVYKAIKARKPTPSQIAKKKYSLSNIKYFIDKEQYDDFGAFVSSVPGLHPSICKQFSSVNQCLTALASQRNR